ncbi:flagellar biosynthesis anti-sigma factor FlgM [Solimonas marina]|uniref:Negative regulator of flagellin synthesis n=1 Tax=Solimonas marina TaxID=2714601 RepID=A0A969W855_9GAMM|nr:flagellar biosynthesis anti-sigma factor FlgM [Solimonas marina]NKF21748.1 flagellar biosynthesis anti-sigma factor FlgM [Solimonas marina]
MTNKITGGPVDSYAALTRTPATNAARSGNTGNAGGAASARTDSVSLTSDAMLLQQTADAVSASDGFDAARVAQVSAELSSGTYKVDPQAIAAKMMKSEWELYG